MTNSFPISVLSILALVLYPVTDSSIITVKAEPLSGSSVAQNTSRQYSSFADYKRDCIEDYRLEGLYPEDIERLCNCAINTFKARFTLEQFKKLTQAANTDAEAENTLIEVGETCFEQILYED